MERARKTANRTILRRILSQSNNYTYPRHESTIISASPSSPYSNVLYYSPSRYVSSLSAFGSLGGRRSERLPLARTIGVRTISVDALKPTMSWPVPGTLMIEPTESESKAELDRFCDALISIREEIAEIEKGKADLHNNVLKGAPHPPSLLMGDAWTKPYSREHAAFPASSLRTTKFWPSTGCVDNVYGDRNLICTLMSPSQMAEEQAAATA